MSKTGRVDNCSKNVKTRKITKIGSGQLKCQSRKLFAEMWLANYQCWQVIDRLLFSSLLFPRSNWPIFNGDIIIGQLLFSCIKVAEFWEKGISWKFSFKVSTSHQTGPVKVRKQLNCHKCSRNTLSWWHVGKRN